jgi:hypothetical protein
MTMADFFYWRLPQPFQPHIQYDRQISKRDQETLLPAISVCFQKYA